MKLLGRQRVRSGQIIEGGITEMHCGLRPQCSHLLVIAVPDERPCVPESDDMDGISAVVV